MAGDRSMYRSHYPALLHFSEAEAEYQIRHGPQSEEFVHHVYGLLEDTKRIRDGVTLLAWPAQDALDYVNMYTKLICARRFTQVGHLSSDRVRLLDSLTRDRRDWGRLLDQQSVRLTASDLASIKQTVPNWESIFVQIPQARLSAAVRWKHPFDAIDPTLSEMTFPVFDDLLEEMHDRIYRGHGWFGVAEWNIANRHYMTALVIALACNNINAVEMLIRFQAENYVAGGDSLSAERIVEDFAKSAARTRAKRFQANWRDLYQAIAFANAQRGNWSATERWIRRVQSELGTTPVADVMSWNIVEHLVDILTFRQNRDALAALSRTVAEIRMRRIML